MHQGIGRALARRGAPFVVAVVVALGAAACGDGDGSAAPPTTPAPATTGPPADGPATTVERGAPRWETVVTLKGTGAAEPPGFEILADSIQWRARWKCETGQLRVTTDPAPRRPAPLVDAACPGSGEGFAIVSGDVRLKIEAAGPWEVIVDQQIDTPLSEPPPEGAASATVLRQGTFYPMEKQAKGTARILTLADGTNVLRLEDFEVSTNVDLFLWLSEAAAPKTSADAVASPYVVLGNLKSTLGSQNYVLPPGITPERMGSLVVWCEPVRQAYGGASLVA